MLCYFKELVEEVFLRHSSGTLAALFPNFQNRKTCSGPSWEKPRTFEQKNWILGPL